MHILLKVFNTRFIQRSMKILFQSRINLFSKPGGDTVQINELKGGLIENGHRVGISTQLKPKLDGYELVHLFNITRVHDTYLQMINAKKQGKPVVCTPIYHDLNEYNQKGRYGIGRKIYSIVKDDERFEYVRGFINCLRNLSEIYPIVYQFLLGYSFQQKTILTGADRIIFGSLREMEAVFAKFPNIFNKITYEIIKIGFASSAEHSDDEIFFRKYRMKNFILCVGRIEDLKNQLTLIRSMKDVKVPLVFIGSLNKAHSSYCTTFINLVNNNDNIHYLGPMRRKLLTSAYAAAKVHVLPSWFETTGLTSVEAGLAGCNVVTTNRGYAHDYLGEYAWYCDPSSISSIRNSVLDAYRSPKKAGLRDHIVKSCSRKRMLDQTIEMYKNVIQRMPA